MPKTATHVNQQAFTLDYHDGLKNGQVSQMASVRGSQEAGLTASQSSYNMKHTNNFNVLLQSKFPLQYDATAESTKKSANTAKLAIRKADSSTI